MGAESAAAGVITILWSPDDTSVVKTATMVGCKSVARGDGECSSWCQYYYGVLIIQVY